MHQDAASPPLISVIIPTRNRVALLPGALKSVWDQKRSDVEIVVVDDASTDSTAEYLGSVAKAGRVRWFRNTTASGACVARNIALREARGKYVTCLDDDDEMLPGRLETMLNALQSGDAFVCSAHIAVQPGGRRSYRPCAPYIDLQRILARNVASTFFAHRDKVMECGGFDESLPAAQDYDLWIRMISRFGPARGIHTPLQLVHEAGLDRISLSMRRRTGYWMVYRKHKSLMERNSRAIHLYNLHKASGKRLDANYARAFFVAGNRLRVVSRVMSERLSFIARPIQIMAEAYARITSR